MTETIADPQHTPIEKARWQLEAEPAALLERLPEMDRVMLALRRDDMMHERLGQVGAILVQEGWMRITGAEHDARVPLEILHTVWLDTTSER